jgi:hypothetical protein
MGSISSTCSPCDGVHHQFGLQPDVVQQRRPSHSLKAMTVVAVVIFPLVLAPARDR